MAHQSHIKSEKYRQWVKAGLGLGYLKKGLTPFCDDVAKQQHNDILDNIKRTKTIPTVLCGTCTLKTLQPDHVKIGKKKCPLYHHKCNCCYTSSKTPCPKSVCGAIYDSIITNHASKPPVPNWKNTQTQKWTTDPWSIAKCFINAPGYEPKTSAADTDCTGLLHVIINNTYFHNHVSCNMTGPNIFSKVREYRNEIFHSSTMELDSTKTNTYIDDMIAVLQDGKELIHRQEAKEAVKNLQDLKKEAFVITTENEEKFLADISVIKNTTKGLAKDNKGLKRKFASLESKTTEIKKGVNYLKGISAKPKTEYESSKADLQKELIKEYRDYLLQMLAMPYQPDHVSNFEDVYVTPRLNLKSKDIETEVKTMSDIFIKDDTPLKSIYILGEAGSGKSSFCKSLVHCWCMAHTDKQNLDGQKVEDYTEYCVDLTKVMKTFNFLFFLPLRDCANKTSIADMIEDKYKHDALKEILKRESCLIVLDGLDEWSHISKCPPIRTTFDKYTVLTTSRPWKIGSLGIKDKEMQQRIYINGFDKTSRMNMITNTLKILQKEFPDNKRGKDKDDPRECERVLAQEPFYSLTHTAMMLQQLICLWFDDKLHGTSKCHLHTCMLDLFFVWHKEKLNKLEERDVTLFDNMQKKSHDIKLPGLLNKQDECKSYSYIVHGISRLAYETLIKTNKATSLTFDSSMFQKLGISDDIKTCCLQLGILSEEKGPSLSASSSRKSHISFIHKSIQEYLAALYIVLKINPLQESSLDSERTDLSDYLSKMLNVKTLDEVLEQENVLITLCGLEPRVVEFISKFIHDSVARDERVLKYRTTINHKYDYAILVLSIQRLILGCIKETKASNKLQKFCFDLWDLYFDDTSNFLRSVSKINITLDSVKSFNIRLPMFKTEDYNHDQLLDYMTRCRNLEAIKLECIFDKEVCQRLCDSIESNATTLKCISIENHFSDLWLPYFTDPSRRALFRHIANMTHLVALQVKLMTLTHADFTSLCSFLSGTGNLQQISIDIKCECKQQHEVDLSKHKHLQYLQYGESVVVTNAVCTSLKHIICLSLNEINCIKVLDLLSYSVNIKEIYLWYDHSSDISQTDLLGRYDCQTTITSKLSKVISLSNQLRELTLHKFTFTDNIITCPYEMNSLESIHISDGKMSLKTWRKFVDSVVELPQHVEVDALNMCITRDGEECNPDIYRRGGGGEEADAFQYVRDNEELFGVYNENENSISFLT